MKQQTENEISEKSPIFFLPEQPSIHSNFFSREWSKKLIERFPIVEPLGGLHNLGNSCFLNSVIQCLCYTPGFAQFALTLPNIVYESIIGKPCFLHYFGELFQSLSSFKIVAPHLFFANLSMVNPDLECGSQQDAHEYLFALLNHFDDECLVSINKSEPEYSSPIHSFFGGQLLETRHCSQCNWKCTTKSKFLDITITLDGDSIESCFENFMSTRDVGSNYICQECKGIGTCSSTTVFAETPNILIITMMRFTAAGVKIEKPVDFGHDLDLGSFSLPETHHQYELFAVINHTGHQITRGHFSCYMKCDNGNWYSADDSKIVRESNQSVLDSRPYVLFYRRKYGELVSPIMVTIGQPKQEVKKKKKLILVKPPEEVFEDVDSGFVSEMSDLDDSIIQYDNRIEVNKSIITEENSIINMKLVYNKNK